MNTKIRSSGLMIDSVLNERGMIVRLAGRSSSALAEGTQLRNELLRLCAAPPRRLVLDLSGLVEVNSAVLGVLLLCRRLTTHSGGTLRLAGMRPAAHKVLELTGLLTLFECCGDVESALSA
jgi:anti-anti-sigma factor